MALGSSSKRDVSGLVLFTVTLRTLNSFNLLRWIFIFPIFNVTTQGHVGLPHCNCYT